MSANGTPYHFERGVQKLAADAGAEDVLQALRQQANVRNRLLYADAKGIPQARPEDAEAEHISRSPCAA
jgi:hypothetical protein